MCLLSLARKTWHRRASVKRHHLSFGEESITETMLMDLADRFPGDVVIQPFNKVHEGRYGADWAWAFQSADGTLTLPMLVQAKLLNLQDTEYPEIKRLVGRHQPPVRQIDLFIQTAESWGWPAIYAFYNHLDDSSRVPDICGSLALAGAAPMPESWGISIADAYNVRAALDDQTFDTHQLHSIAFHCLLCGGGSGRRGSQGSPEVALRALHGLRGALPFPDVDSDKRPLPDAPFLDTPAIFHAVRAAASADEPTIREARVQALREEFPQLAGVVILRDEPRTERDSKP
ncbi:DUF6615 family protein [Bauldia litoralis]|uniref:DUF6615 family protein n=2 Tax=Pseudomonadota TaxID=1224 RepID=UPI00326558A0